MRAFDLDQQILIPDETSVSAGVKHVSYSITLKESMMFKKLLLGTTVVAATLASAQLLANPEHRHNQNKACAEANCPATSQSSTHRGEHGMERGAMREKMQAMHGQHQRGGSPDKPSGHGTQRGNAVENCPMRGESKSS